MILANTNKSNQSVAPVTEITPVASGRFFVRSALQSGALTGEFVKGQMQLTNLAIKVPVANIIEDTCRTVEKCAADGKHKCLY
jgi:hypothetical protein